MPPVGSNRQIGADFQCSARGLCQHAHDFSIFLQKIGGLGLHLQVKTRISFCLLDDEIQKIPLRHQSNKFAVGGQMGEIRDGDGLAADLAGQMSNFLVGSFEEFIQNAELVHDFESGRMNRIAAEIAEEVGMLLQHDYIDAPCAPGGNRA